MFMNLKNIQKYLGYFDYESKSGKKTRQFNFLISIKEPFKIRLSEHDNYAWVTKSDLDNFLITSNVKKILSLI